MADGADDIIISVSRQGNKRLFVRERNGRKYMYGTDSPQSIA